MHITEFAPRVSVFSPDGALLFFVHAARAAQIVTNPEQIRKRQGGHIREIAVAECVPHSDRPPSAPTLNQYMGQKYTRTERTLNAAGEVDGRVCQFKFIHPGDRPLFRLSVTDCMRA